LKKKLTKKSELVGKECHYVKTSKINKLPYYLVVQYVRFYWNAQAKTKAKIVRPVEFPLKLDMYDYATDELKAKLFPVRKQIQDLEDKKLHDKKTISEKSDIPTGKQEQKTSYKESLEPKEVDPSKFVNETGTYELFAVLTHKGRSADSGHYIGWIKESEDKWLKYDDDRVSFVNNDEIKKLSGKGGADWHMAYITLYRSIHPPPEITTSTSSAATTSTSTTSTSTASMDTSK